MHLSRLVYWHPFVEIARYRNKSAVPWTASIQHICDGLDALLQAVGLKIAA